GYGGAVWSSAEIYDPDLGTWSATGPMLAPRTRHAAALLRNGRVLVGGGECDSSCPSLAVASAELFDPRTNTFSATSPMRLPRMFHAFVALPDGSVLVAGGWTPATGGT